MIEDDSLTPDERKSYIARYGEYRRVPVARYGPFRLDREWMRHFTFGEREFSMGNLVFEIDASAEFDMTGTGMELYRMSGMHVSDGLIPIPSHSQVVQLVHLWLRIWRPCPGGGTVSVACYRRRVDPPGGEYVATPGEWYIPPLFRRPSNPMIDMHEATPLVEAALRELEQAEDRGSELGQES